MASQDRIKHVIVLMLENRSFDHYFGFFKPATGQKVENLLGANAGLSNLLDPSKPASANNPSFKVPPFNFDRLGLRVPTIVVSPWIQKGMVENRRLQHTSVIKTMTDMFKLKGPLNKRDESASSFADLFQQLGAPRPASDMPDKLPRPSLANATVSLALGNPIDPADEPLDTLTREWVEGFAALTAGTAALGTPRAAPGAMPATHEDASQFINERLKTAFGI